MATPPPMTMSDGLKKFTTLASIEPTRRPADWSSRDGDRVAERGRPGDVLRGDRAALVEGGPEPRAAALCAAACAGPPERGAAGERLEAADVAAAADDRRVVGDLDVADVAGTPLGAAMEAAVGDDPGADAGADLDDDDVVVAGRDPRAPLARAPGR